MAPAGKRVQHPHRVLPVGGLAENFAAAVHHGVAADDHILRVILGHGLALCGGQSQGGLGRGGGGDGGLVHLTGDDGKLRADHGKQLLAAGAAGCEDQ